MFFLTNYPYRCKGETFMGRITSRWILVALSALMLTACGGGGVSDTPPVTPTIATISAQPADTTVYETQTATFSVTASSNLPLSYQWYQDSVAISGATSSSYTTPATVMSDSGALFSVTLSNSVGTMTSSAALLTLQAAGPTITTQPTNQSVISGQTATFSVTASGLPSLTYQWLKNGVAITGATSSSYATPATLGDNGSAYSVTVRNGADNSLTSSSAPLTVLASSLIDLVISEVATCVNSNVDCWFEIYNPTSSAIDLVNYQIKSTSLNVVTLGSVVTTTFTLPSFSVPADGHVILSGNYYNSPQLGTQMLRVRSGNISPFWTASGFIELLDAGGATTVDFVRFGTSLQVPVTAEAWSGDSVAALPYSIADYGKSIVRMYPGIAATDTNAAGDWSSVNWSTPAGRNDVPTSAVDADGDGIPDSAEISGGTFAGLDLYAMGARTGQRDLFLHINQMNSTDPGVIPRQESLQKVVDSFAAQNIQLHFDAGTMFSPTFSVANFNLGQGNSVVAYEQCVTFDQVTCYLNTPLHRSVYDWKNENMDLRRRQIFHYLLFGNSQLANGSNGSSGRAELPGNDIIVTMGGWGFTTWSDSALNMLINMQAPTLMHELGHNLGLRHGGFEDANYKPNYWSVMNYLYQLNGLDGNPAGSTAYERWRSTPGLGDGSPLLCGLANSPCGSPAQFIMDYSDGTSTSLNETSLFEANNIGRGNSGGTTYADWNMGGTLTATAQARDLNGDAAQTTLSDSNDWANLSLPFNRGSGVNTGISRTSSPNVIVANPITNDRQPTAEEFAPSPAFFEELRRVQ
ncbi:MAG: immunoglobulin domain-containing protein [Gallionellaceae bacterium]|nr:immunoglobulin domain-containing protein [Gallionellaceae bacterium]